MLFRSLEQEKANEQAKVLELSGTNGELKGINSELTKQVQKLTDERNAAVIFLEDTCVDSGQIFLLAQAARVCLSSGNFPPDQAVHLLLDGLVGLKMPSIVTRRYSEAAGNQGMFNSQTRVREEGGRTKSTKP